MTRVALCFPGQGSQVAGMADSLVEEPLAAELLGAAAAEGLDLAAALRGDDEALRPTDVAQPALLLSGVVLGAAITAAPGVAVVGVAGHSVGEYSALVCAGALDAQAAMRLVVARGRAMARTRAGGMLALLGASDETAQAVCDAVLAEGGGPLVVANLNAPGQVVLSGSSKAVRRAAELARGHGVRRAMQLRVSGAFHSPLMEPAATEIGELIDAVEVRDARVPVAVNVDGALVSDAATLRARLRAQLVSPVRWTDCVRSLATLSPDRLVEAGPQAVLTGLARRIAPDIEALAVARLGDAGSVADRSVAAVHQGADG